MKKNFLIVAAAIGMSSAVMAQSLTTYSRADVNQDNSVTVEDVTDAVNATLARANFQEGKVVDTYELNQTLQQIFTAIAELKSQINEVNSTVVGMKYDVETAGKDFVDMGLPSGTLWAPCNLGADKPEDPGKYFAWGDNQGWRSSEIPTYHSFYDSDYKWFTDDYVHIKKYTFDDGFYNLMGWEGRPSWYDYNYSTGYKFVGNNKTKLEYIDDAAWRELNGDWGIPTPEQFEELWENCSHQYLANAIKLTSRITGNSIILPITDMYSGSKLTGADESGCYWTNTLGEYSFNAQYCYIWSKGGEGNIGLQYNGLRSQGLCIRPCCSKKE